ncbi:venom allergen 5-like isoform X2 [Homarus americanus]|uniref:venom allergen 5-like isoform X2 n=1 Tax=Homarus americanus TaxID=6706 RepID=UPI001C48AB3D|nr:venom allergen 5-like isoform X2 [Homarus americanus]
MCAVLYIQSYEGADTHTRSGDHGCSTTYCARQAPPTLLRFPVPGYVAQGNEKLGDLGPQPSGANIQQLVWNDELAQVAEAWASQCRRGHDGYPKRKICSRNYVVGQNIFYQWSNNPASVWTKAVKSWYNEVSYMPNTYVSTFNAVPPSNKVITHYSQVVWAKTYEVGCGAVYYTTMFRGKTYTQSKIYVCNYGPAANYRNRPVYLEGVPASQCPNTPSEVYIGLCN